MPRKCSVFQYVIRDSIDYSLIQGEPLWTIAGRSWLSAASLHRHKEDHLPKALRSFCCGISLPGESLPADLV